MTRKSPLEQLRTWLDAPWIYLGHEIESGYAQSYLLDCDEVREQLFAELMGWDE